MHAMKTMQLRINNICIYPLLHLFSPLSINRDETHNKLKMVSPLVLPPTLKEYFTVYEADFTPVFIPPSSLPPISARNGQPILVYVVEQMIFWARNQ